MPVVRTPDTKGFNPKESRCAYIPIRRRDPVAFLGSSSWALKPIRPKRTTPNAISTNALVCRTWSSWIKVVTLQSFETLSRDTGWFLDAWILYLIESRKVVVIHEHRIRKRWLNRDFSVEKSWWYTNSPHFNSIYVFLRYFKMWLNR